MAAIRSPGDISPKEGFTQVKYRYVPNKIQPANSSEIIPYGAFTTGQQLTFRSVRPSYLYGNKITLSDGSKFITSTNYMTESQSLYFDSEPYECSYFERGTTYSIHRGVQDSGREIGEFILRRSQFLVFGSSTPLGAKNEAIVKCLTKLADQKVNLGENLATLHQTARMFVDKSWQIYALLTHAKLSTSWKQFVKMTSADLRDSGILSTPAREYLAFVYGFQPLYKDVFELHKLLKEQAAKPLLLKAVGSSTRIQSPQAKKIPLTNAWLYSFGGSATCKVKCTLWAELDPENAFLRSLNQLGLANPVSLAWDLVPFSFVVDWFVPVGPVLQALSAPYGLRFVDGSTSTRISEEIRGGYKGRTSVIDWDSATNKHNPKFEIPKLVTLKHDHFSRVALSNWPLPGLYIDANPFRSDRSLKALALGVIGLSGSRSPIR